MVQYSLVPLTLVQSHPRKYIAMYFHPEHPKSMKDNCNNPVPWSAVLSCPVLSSPVQAYPLNYSAVYFNLERNVKRNALRLSQVKYNLKQYGAAIRVKCHSENATFSSQSAQSGPVTAV